MYLQTVRLELFPQLLISNPPYLLHYKQKSQHLSLDQPPLLKTEQILKFLHRCVSTDVSPQISQKLFFWPLPTFFFSHCTFILRPPALFIALWVWTDPPASSLTPELSRCTCTTYILLNRNTLSSTRPPCKLHRLYLLHLLNRVVFIHYSMNRLCWMNGSSCVVEPGSLMQCHSHISKAVSMKYLNKGAK